VYICLFDIDGTLLSSGGAGKAAMEGGLQSEFGLARVNQDVPFSGRTDLAIGKELLQVHGIDGTEPNWHRLRSAYLNLLPDSLARHKGRILPGIAALLENLGGQKKALLGLLTGNIREGARLKLGHYRLFHYFSFGGFGDRHLDRNDVAHEALEVVNHQLNGQADPDKIWIIGDTPLDIRCARAIQAKVAAVATGWHSLDELAAEKPDLLFPDLSNPHLLLQMIG
jgi:phosphoglycolate phosphatase-like HAD superfamily hydrolase